MTCCLCRKGYMEWKECNYQEFMDEVREDLQVTYELIEVRLHNFFMCSFMWSNDYLLWDLTQMWD